MTRIEALLTEAEDAPEELLEETLHFLRFLKSRRNPEILDIARVETMLLSESALAKDWLRPEEDEAWQDL
jgi:hypothetical protein